MNINDDVSKKELMDDLYSHLKFLEAVDLWTAFFAKSEEEVQYSNWRHLNAKRQKIENNVWNKIIYPGSKILDIGCGKGFFLKRLYENFGQSVKYYGLDISTVVIDRAQKYFEQSKYFVCSAENLSFKSKSFDYIQIISALEEMINPDLAIREAYRVLKDKGYLYIVIHKKSLDPLIIRAVYLKFIRFFKKNTKNNYEQYCLPLVLARNLIFKSIKEVTFRMIESNDLVSYINVPFYRKLHLPMIFLLRIAEITNNLPISVFKNLEYRIYQK